MIPFLPSTTTVVFSLFIALLSHFLTTSYYSSPVATPTTMAYGAISAPLQLGDLPVLSFNLQKQKTLTTFPLTLESTPQELRETMWEIFDGEINSQYTHTESSSLPRRASSSSPRSPSLFLFSLSPLFSQRE